MTKASSSLLSHTLVFVGCLGLAYVALTTAPIVDAQSGGLVAAYSFNEGAGTIAGDSSGNGNTGSLTAATWTGNGRFGGALVFNGNSARVTIPDSSSLDLTDAMTLEAWVMPAAVPNRWRSIITKDVDRYYLFAGSDNQKRPATGGTFAATNQNVYGPAALPVGSWTHLAATYDRTAIRLFVNGVQVASGTQTAAISTSNAVLTIGANFYGEYFNGLIDEVRIYNRALTVAEIQADMTVAVPNAVDTTPPTAPANLTATTPGSGQVNLAWVAATDNVGVTGYEIERCIGTGCTNFSLLGTTTTPNFADSGLTASSTVRYRVRAKDAANNFSTYSNIVTVVVPAPDTTAPTTPSGLTATAASGPSAVLSWVASSDNIGVLGYEIERCTGSGCTTFAALATTTGVTYTDVAVAAGSNYSYRVRARDAAGNTSAFSNTASVAMPALDTTPPTVPTNISASAAGPGQITVSWTASSDASGIAGYQVQRCQGTACATFVTVTTVTTTSYTDSGLAASTEYGFRVEAIDTPGNHSGYSTAAYATTVAQTSGLVAAYAFNEGAGTAAADSSGTGNAGVVSGATWTTGGKFGGALSFNGTNTRVVVSDSPSVDLTEAMTLEAWVMPAAVPNGWRSIIAKDVDRYYLFAGSDNQNRPATGGTFAATNQNVYGTAVLPVGSWAHLAATYDRTTIRLFVNGVQVATGAQTAAISTSNAVLTIGANFYGEYFNGLIDEVRIYNRALTLQEIQADMATPIAPAAPDTTPPTAPTSLSATAPNQSQIDLTWGASTDNVGVVSYGIERCQGAGCTAFAQIATVTAPTTTFSDSGLTAGTSYRYRVLARDGAQNASAYSNAAGATTPAPDVESPTAPGTLSATASSGTQINLSWGAASDNVGVTGYRVERCQGVGCSSFTKFGTTITGTTFSDTGLSLNTSYSYIVRAEDAAGNLGPYSNVASATTLGSNPNLIAAYSFDEGTGAVIGDSSGHSHHGTITNATWVTAGKFGKALSFNGTNALATIPDAPELRLTNGMTLEAWVNPSVTNIGWRDVIYKGNDNYYLEGSTDSNGGAPGIGIIVGGAHAEVFGSAPLPVNTWTFLAATYDGATLRLFLNGIQVSSLARAGSITTSTNPVQIGGDSIFGQFFQGLIDEVRIYNVALTPSQIQADLVTPLGSVPALSLSPQSIDFGHQPVNTSSTVQSVTLMNTGNQPLSITSVSVTGANASEFTQTNTCATPVAPGSTCRIDVVFTPTVVSARSASINVAYNASGSPRAVGLSGIGDGFGISPRVAVLTTSQTQQFVVAGQDSTGVIWSVDGTVGGTATTGTVSASGLFTAPATGGTHIVTVSSGDGTKSASASTYVTTNAGVFTHRIDNARTGQYLTESVLKPSNVNMASFGKLASYPIDGIPHASPLYVANVSIPNVGIRNVVYIATEHDSVYAFDADGRSASPLWKVSFINPAAGITTVSIYDVGECCDIKPEIGITGTPVIDPASKTLYVVAKTKEGPTTFVQRLHALDIATGAEKFGGPVVIQASVPGTGTGSSNGQVPFDALRENQRTALLLHNGVVYFGFGSHGDIQPYHGWVLGYNATTLQRVFVFNTTPNGEGGGVWESGGGIAVDGSGNLYFATGDGTFSKDIGGIDYGDTFLKVSPSGTVLDYFTPHDQGFFNSNNLDLDAGGLILLPDQAGAHPRELVSAGKDGSIFLVDRDNMGQYRNPDGNVQTLPNIFPFGTPLPGNYSSPVYFNGKVYFGPVADVAQAFTLTNGLLSTGPTSTTSVPYPYPGATLAISASGAAANGILWTVRRPGEGVPGTLHAYDPNNLGVEFYNSDQAGPRDGLDVATKFSLPLIVNGRVYLATEGKLSIFGLLP